MVLNLEKNNILIGSPGEGKTKLILESILAKRKSKTKNERYEFIVFDPKLSNKDIWAGDERVRINYVGVNGVTPNNGCLIPDCLQGFYNLNLLLNNRLRSNHKSSNHHLIVIIFDSCYLINHSNQSKQSIRDIIKKIVNCGREAKISITTEVYDSNFRTEFGLSSDEIKNNFYRTYFKSAINYGVNPMDRQELLAIAESLETDKIDKYLTITLPAKSDKYHEYSKK